MRYPDAVRVLLLPAVLIVACSTDPEPSSFPEGGADGPFDPEGCTLIGCESGVFATKSIHASLSSFVGTEVKVCLNGTCQTGVATTPTPNGLAMQVALSAGACTAFFSFSSPDDTALDVRCPLTVLQCIDGGSFTIDVRGADGGAGPALDRPLTYKDLYPNGQACGPHCRSLVIAW